MDYELPLFSYLVFVELHKIHGISVKLDIK